MFEDARRACTLRSVDTEPAPAAPKERSEEDSLLEGLTRQLSQARLLLSANPEGAADEAMSAIAAEREVEAKVTTELATPHAVAQPERFLAAHRTAIQALELLDREGWRKPSVSSKFGPLKPAARIGAQYVTQYIVKGYANSAANSMRRLYTRREPQTVRGTPERIMLAQARMEMDRLTNGFAGGGFGAPAIIAGGAAISLFASVTQFVTGLNYLSRPVLISTLLLIVIMFGVLSSLLLTAAGVAHRRCQVIAGQALADLWEAVGRAGNPPEDNSQPFAIIAIVLSALVWVVVPVGGILVYVLT